MFLEPKELEALVSWDVFLAWRKSQEAGVDEIDVGPQLRESHGERDPTVVRSVLSGFYGPGTGWGTHEDSRGSSPPGIAQRGRGAGQGAVAMLEHQRVCPSHWYCGFRQQCWSRSGVPNSRGRFCDVARTH